MTTLTKIRINRAALMLTLGILTSHVTLHAQFVAISDDFSTTAPLTGSTPDSGSGNWTTISGAPAISVSGGSAQLAATGGEASQLNFRSTTGDFSTGIFYYGFDFTVATEGTINTSATLSALAGFREGTAASGSFEASFSVFRPTTAARTNSGLPTAGADQVVAGLFIGATFNAESSNLTEWSAALDRGTTYRVVIGLNLDTDTATLWINPTSLASTSIQISGVTDNARGIFLRQGAASHGAVSVDNVVLNTDFSTAATTVPEPSVFAFLGGFTALGFTATRRRSRHLSSASSQVAAP
jgi:hypothetical protein